MAEVSVPGMREILLLAAALVAIYLIALLVRLRRPTSRAAQPPGSSPAASVAGPEAPRVEPVTMGPEISDSDFASQLAKTSVGLEVQRLRREVAQLRADVVRLGEEVRQLKATHNVSPIYSEAMTLAERGELPAGIAARCGISLGEAELVAALARREFGDSGAGGFDDPYRDTGH